MKRVSSVTNCRFFNLTFLENKLAAKRVLSCAFIVLLLALAAPTIALAGPLISAGGDYTLAVDSNGNLFAWGQNNFGQLGLGDTADRAVPARVGTASNWIEISTGQSHSLALQADGTLYTWGQNNFGQLGLGDTTNRTVPTSVGTASNWIEISAGRFHSLALNDNGDIYVWGNNANGRLGIGNTTNQNSPVLLPSAGVSGNAWTAISAGGTHTLALRDNGELYVWGGNANGRLGLGDTNQRTTPVQLPTTGISGNEWTAIATGDAHTLALRDNGELYVWGSNANGRLGLGDTTQRTTPMQLPTTGITGTSWTSITAGDAHTLAIRDDGSMWAWGNNNGGRLGLGDTTMRLTPYEVLTAPVSGNDWVAVSAGVAHTIALRDDGTLWTWGINAQGQLGQGDTTTRRVPTLVSLPEIAAAAGPIISAGSDHTLAINTSGQLFAWGFGAFTGEGTNLNRNTPTLINDSNLWTSISAGPFHSLAVSADGGLFAWGQNNHGQLGDGTNTNRSIPTLINSATSWTEVSAGRFHSLAICTDGGLWTWGNNSQGQLGNGDTISVNAPERIGNADDWIAISAGSGHLNAGSHSFALNADGELYAWGRNDHGQLGDGTTVDKNIPVRVSSANYWVEISAGFRHSLAICTDGGLWTWGNNSQGQLGNGIVAGSIVPTQIGNATNWAKVSGGGLHSLAINDNGELFAWGRNLVGQLGQGTTTDSRIPLQVGSASNWVAISAGEHNSFAVNASGQVYAWGDNWFGNLGDGYGAPFTGRGTPVRICNDGSFGTSVTPPPPPPPLPLPPTSSSPSSLSSPSSASSPSSPSSSSSPSSASSPSSPSGAAALTDRVIP